MSKNNLRKAIKAKGLTVVAFAKAARVSRSYVYEIIKGRFPSVRLAKRLVRVLGLSLDELFPLIVRLKMKINEKLIRKLMTQTGYTQNQLARKMGVQPGSLSNVLSGRRKPGRKVLSGLLKVFPLESVASLTLNDRK